MVTIKNKTGEIINVSLTIFLSLLVNPGFEKVQNWKLTRGTIVINPRKPEIIHRNSDHFSGWYKFRQSVEQGLKILTKYSNTMSMFNSHGIDDIIQMNSRIPNLANNSLA